MAARRLGIGLLAILCVLGISAVVYLLSPDAGRQQGRPGTGSPSAAGVPEDAELARVRSHVDGDTVRLSGTGRSSLLPAAESTVRLLEIDTPEHGRDGRVAECYADEASAALRDLLPVGADVWVARDVQLHDPYGRTLLYLWDADGRFVNLELVRRGYARAVLFEPNDEYIDEMRKAESRARVEARGLWGAC